MGGWGGGWKVLPNNLQDRSPGGGGGATALVKGKPTSRDPIPLCLSTGNCSSSLPEQWPWATHYQQRHLLMNYNREDGWGRGEGGGGGQKKIFKCWGDAAVASMEYRP